MNSAEDFSEVNATLLCRDKREDAPSQDDDFAGVMVMDFSFPNHGDEAVEIQTSNGASDDGEEEVHKETEEEQMQQDFENSEALARQLMGEKKKGMGWSSQY